MAKFRGNELYLADGQRVRFGDHQDANMWWDSDAQHPTTSGDLRVNTTISGVDPIYDYHITTKNYVDSEVATLSGTIPYDHGELIGLSDDDHIQYVPTNGSRGFTGTVSGIDPTQDYHLTTKNYVDGEIDTLSGTIPYSHSYLTGLDVDDHTQYSLVNGTRAFTGTVGGIYPTATNHLTTKEYVDQLVQGLDWQDSVLDFSLAVSGVAVEGNRYIALDTSGNWTEDYIMEYTGTAWSGTAPNEGFATWVEDEDALYVYNGSDWVKFGSTITHNNLNGLQGGTSDEYYHLTSTMYTDLTSAGGVGNASSEHIHDDRYYTESEVDTISGALSSEIDADIAAHAAISSAHHVRYTDEEAQDAVGNIMSGASFVTVTYNDIANTITISGSASAIDHGYLSGLEDDDHTQYILVDGTRGFTATVSGVYPTEDYHLATKSYVDAAIISGTIDRHGRSGPITYKASQWTVNFADLGHTDYTVNVTMENTADSPPSIYSYIISARTSSSFTVDFSGKMDSSNYYLDWNIIED